MEVSNLVGGSAAVCGPDVTLSEAADVMIGSGIGSLGVVEGGRLIGIVSERDVLRAVAEKEDPDRQRVADWMTPEPDSVTPDIEVEDAAEWLLATGYRHLPVVDDSGKLHGIVSIKDILWALREPAEHQE